MAKFLFLLRFEKGDLILIKSGKFENFNMKNMNEFSLSPLNTSYCNHSVLLSK